MLAFEEMRKRLEEQHAQQLSILIAEQEREQEKLQKVKQREEEVWAEVLGVEVCQDAAGFEMYILLLCRLRKLVLQLISSFIGTGGTGEEGKEDRYDRNRDFQSEY